jgi:signal transduction histidine kinase/ActR/RegA family two-component response regulator
MLEAARERDLPLGDLALGLSVPLQTLLDPSSRISWDDFTRVLENAARLLGGPEVLEQVACRYYSRSGSILGVVAAGVFDVRPLYHMGARWYGPSLYACTRATCVDLPDGRIRQTIEILPDYRDSKLFFHGMRGALRTGPLLLGQPLAEVEMEVSPRRGVYLISPPPALSLWHRLRRILSRRSVLDTELALYNDEVRRTHEQARSAHERLDTERQRLEEVQRERERALDLLQQAQRVDAMGRLAGGIAHDMNNVLTAIGGYAELALERVGRADPIAADLEEIRHVSERGAGLVKQILAFERHQSRAARPLELTSVLLGMQSMLSRLLPERVELAVLPAEAPVLVLASPVQIEQIIVNLVVNARDAGAGHIAVELRTAEPPARSPAAAAAGGLALIEVRDDGRGMDRETLARAFDPFFTTRGDEGGTGLGLATVREIAERCGGSVHIESEPGHGTRVVVQLPQLAEAAADEPRGRGADAIPGGSETVLVVEDEADVRIVLTRTLEARGYKVLVAGDAEGALRAARIHDGPLDLLVCDVVLPDADGRLLARRIDALRPELRGAVFVSGHLAAAASPEPPGLGERQALLAKPFDAPALLDAVRRILDA